MEKKQEFIKAVQIGSVCIFSYLASYYMRHILSVSTPGMLETGIFTKEIVGTLSSVYFFIYAIGQLINGRIGDKVSPKKMVFWGLSICGVASMTFAFTKTIVVWIILFAVMGFSLSMLRGPLVKTISENTMPDYARVCCVFLSAASFAGPLVASLFAMIFNWKYTFVASGISCISIAFCAYIVLSLLEKKGFIEARTVDCNSEKKKKIWSVFKLENFAFYIFIGALIEISAASINFWMPTYLTERLNFNNNIANVIFSVIALVRSLVPFVALIIFKWFKENDIRMIRCCYISAALFFLGVLFASNPYVNIFLFIIALVSISCSSALLWSVYIPNQRKSGMISTINGVFDFSGYIAASAANILFSFTIDKVGWNGIIVMWILLMISGVIAGFFAKKEVVTVE